MCVNDKWKNNCDIPFIAHCFVVFIFSHSRWQELSSFLLTLHYMRKLHVFIANWTVHILYTAELVVVLWDRWKM